MRTFGLLLLVVGIVGFFYCSSQLDKLDPLPEGLTITGSLKYPAGKMEVGRFAAVAAGGIGVLFMMFPTGR
jgi:hypothetical protein